MNILQGGWDWVVDNRAAIGNVVAIGAALGAMTACFVVTAGACAFAGVVAASVGLFNNLTLQEMDPRTAIGIFVVNLVFVGAGWGVGAGLKGAIDLSRADRAFINLPWTVPVIACTASQKC